MEDYTKFKLKSKDELLELLGGRDSLSVIACNKCFKEFTGQAEPELDEFLKLARGQGKTIAWSMRADFLCNGHLTENMLEKMEKAQPEKAGCVFVIACGLGIQTLAGLIKQPVCAAADSVSGESRRGMLKGQHALALTKLNCAACGRCYLNETGGICPIADCSKSLINGQCGGARDGKCEIDDDKDCAWEKIYEALAEAGTASDPASGPVRIHDYSKVNYKLINSYVKAIREKRTEGFYGGLYLHEKKGLTEHSGLIRIPAGDANELPGAGRPGEGFGKFTAGEIIEIIHEKGIIGMGGAGFPTYIKLNSPKPVDTVMLNGCECEPLLTADHRVMLEFPDDIVSGLKIMMKVTGAQSGIIAIEDNKPDAVRLLAERTAGMPEIDTIAVKTKYPQGAEKMLIKRVLGRSVPKGGLPFDVGVIVSNVSTAKAVSDAVCKGLPLTERVVTVTGDKIRRPGNYIVKIGTPVGDVIDYCGGLTDAGAKVLLGGPMMGVEVTDLNTPVTKTANGIIAIEPASPPPSPCIRCGRCADACPMELLPLYYPVYAEKQDSGGMADKAVTDCIECGCCDYICPSKIPIREAVRAGKELIKN